MGRDAGSIVFLIDDDEAVLKALSRLLNAANYQTTSFKSARRFMERCDDSVKGCAVVDLSMDEIDGLALQDHLTATGVNIPVIFLTGTGDISSSVRAMKAGAIDFLTKPVDGRRLLEAVARAIDADSAARSRLAEAQAINGRLAALTPREHEVLRHVVAGRLNKQIAASLGTVEKTIKVHRSRMMQKLGVRCMAELVRMSDRVGIVPARAENVGPKVNSTLVA